MRSCARCQSRLDLEGVSVEPPRAHGTQLARRGRRAAARLYGGLDQWVRRASRTVGAHLHPGVDWTAVFVSIIPGMGHVRMGARRTGLLFFAGWVVLVALSLMYVGTTRGWLLALATVGYHCFVASLLLAPATVLLPLTTRLAVGFIVYAAVMLLFYVPLITTGRCFVRSIGIFGWEDGYPVARGDGFAYTGMFNRPDDWRPGDLVVYPIYRNEDGVIIRGRLGMGLILAVAGDHIICSDDEISINGVPLRGRLTAELRRRRLVDRTLTLADDHYAVLPVGLDGRSFFTGGLDYGITALARRLEVVDAAEFHGRVLWQLRPWHDFGPEGRVQLYD